MTDEYSADENDADDAMLNKKAALIGDIMEMSHRATLALLNETATAAAKRCRETGIPLTSYEASCGVLAGIAIAIAQSTNAPTAWQLMQQVESMLLAATIPTIVTNDSDVPVSKKYKMKMN